MSVTAQTPYKKYTAAPGATLFTTTFRLLLASDLIVKVDGVVVASGFTLSGLGASSSDVTFGTPMVGGEMVELQRSVPKTRATDYQQLGDYEASSVNNDFDRIVMMHQDSQFLNDLALLLPPGDSAAPMTLPNAALRAGMFLAFDALGNAIAAAGASGVPVSAFMATVLDDLTAAAARATLGAQAAGSYAASGVNSDITSLNGLTTPLSTAQGGSGYATGAPTRIESITASVAANALTLTLNPTTLAFRSATLGSGTVNPRPVAAAISLVISSGSTLGAVSAQLTRVAVVAIDNAGTVELAAVNMAGGNDLSETGLITTVAEGGAGAADSNNVFYSNTARTSVPYRVVGYVEFTQATAGTYATAPSTIQGYGGQALAAMSSLGYGQTWQDVSGSRTGGTTYYNLTGKPFFVAMRSPETTDGVTMVSLTISGQLIGRGGYGRGGAGDNGADSVFGIVPPGGSYSCTGHAAWYELR